ncbi:hypothetical protein TIFTF001_028096 [Ficus carica]|uniref:Uncharacterized protein n=1 Tax=Ficus carica TaxID=3494 RepID=A0AA88DPM5_FICCA|nr:hypothetical protein TIFTF001_028096 [Ficus carica]
MLGPTTTASVLSPAKLKLIGDFSIWGQDFVLVDRYRDRSSGPYRLRTSEAADLSKLVEPGDRHPPGARRSIACEPHRRAVEIREVIWSSLVAIAILCRRSSSSPSVTDEHQWW